MSSSSVGSAISASSLNIRPSSRNGRRSSSSSLSFSSSASCDDSDLTKVVALIDKLLLTPQKSIYDPSVSSQIQQLKSQLFLLDTASRHRLNQKLRNKTCLPYASNVPLPETVGSYICGCFLPDNTYGTLKPPCTSLCAGSALNGGDNCNQTVLHWTRDSNGLAVSHHQSGSSPNCNVFIDPGLVLSNDQKTAFLNQAGCRSANYFNAVNNTPLLQTQDQAQQVQWANTVAAAAPLAPNVAVTPGSAGANGNTGAYYPASTQSTVMAAFAVQNPSAGVATGAAGTVAQPISTGGISLWITFGIILFILIVLVVAFALWRYSAAAYRAC